MTKVIDAVGDNEIRLGMSGPTVAVIQLALRDLGYGLRGSGYYGTGTDTAVEAFQRKAGLSVDGVVGPLTAYALDLAVAQLSIADAPPEKLPLWVEAGEALVGVKEGPGAKDNPLILDWARQEGGAIAREYTHDSIPWCALFLNHIMTKAGHKGTETLWALDWAGKWPAQKLRGPAVGAVAPMERDGGGHVIVVVGRTAAGDIVGLGGNQHDMVCYAVFPQTRLDHGFWWPNGVALPTRIGFGGLPLLTATGEVSTKEA